MEGTKYTQHKLTDNITCMNLYPDTVQIHARLPDQLFTYFSKLLQNQ